MPIPRRTQGRPSPESRSADAPRACVASLYLCCPAGQEHLSLISDGDSSQVAADSGMVTLGSPSLK